MLTCVYHPIDSMRVVEEDEAETLRATGVWFDCPSKAQNYRAKVEQDIKKEKASKPDSKKQPQMPKDKPEEKSK
ncbi:MAG TPA: hypothetical protein VEA37_03760 [Flavobacterium sp.]|nr:hypothetical protein [Flavobacterium sp.]